MRNWNVLVVVGVVLVLVTVCVEGHLGNNLVHDAALPTCADLLHEAAPSPPSLTAPLPPDLRGKWFSTR
ncbi:hypothetical protein Pcinc_022477 [Petrolisthes cinctipes]|uniref:Secreted protein n=1 Tax=Petrolisthes cinctipes TaxID=88211 RepID=A0AAE1FHQ0_PETCI|nr:hypothetical protein Pcinc_022477 [Petrolisthes cinctipes]